MRQDLGDHAYLMNPSLYNTTNDLRSSPDPATCAAALHDHLISPPLYNTTYESTLTGVDRK